jgi:aspartyl/asparaginyl beta-hydroxylase (cupin superfamily)
LIELLGLHRDVYDVVLREHLGLVGLVPARTTECLTYSEEEIRGSGDILTMQTFLHAEMLTC